MQIINTNLKKKLIIIWGSIKWSLKLILIDQLSKWWLIANLPLKPGRTIKLFNILDFVYTWNYGISFGILRQYYQYSNVAFTIINSAIIIYLGYLVYKCKTVLSYIGYNFIIGGAIGNIIDRIYRGAVFDFIYIHYEEYGFAIFNLADSFITIGALILIYDFYINKKSLEQKANKNYDDLEIKAEKIRNASK